jgi:hypothetical protein
MRAETYTRQGTGAPASKNNPKSWKALPIDIKDRQISWNDFNGFSFKPEMYLFPT